jgi:hypothetical protein
MVGRKGNRLFAGDDDLFSWAACFDGYGFGIFPDLRLTHLIPSRRLVPAYVVALIRDHTFSHQMIRYELAGTKARRINSRRCIKILLHGLRNGLFSMRCQWAAAQGEARAARVIIHDRMQPLAVREAPPYEKALPTCLP